MKGLVEGKVNVERGQTQVSRPPLHMQKISWLAMRASGLPLQALQKFCPHVPGNHTCGIWRKEGLEYSHGDPRVAFQLKKLLR